MARMRRTCKIRDGSCVLLFGVLFFIAGIFLVVHKPLYNEVIGQVHQSTVLVEGTAGFDAWSATMRLFFRICLFHVLNPDGIMKGELPKLEERGPYVYDELMSKQVLGMDEERDEISYTVTKNYKFNQKLSGNFTEDDEVTIINPAYLGPINMLATFPPALLNQYGNHIIKLFPNSDTIFVTGKVKDIFFRGLPLICDEKIKELEFMCNMLKSKRPPILRENGKEGVYAYSLFHKLNGTAQGPYTVNRGSKDLSQLGDTTSIKGKRKTKYWANKTCDIVKGTDSITWAPMDERIPRVYTYVEDICRSMWTEYKDDVVVDGVIGWRYTLTERIWEPDEVQCYCPLKKKVANCLPKGLLDIAKCQEAPVIMSEPHFLHGDPEFLRFAGNVNPVEDKHFTFIIIDPLTGAPLHGEKKLQLNMKLQKLQVTLLENVSEGYFPIFWCSEGGQPERTVVKLAHQARRTIKVVQFIECIPVVLGVFLMLAAFIMCNTSKRAKRRKAAWVQDGVTIPSQITSRTVIRRTSNRSKGAIG